MLTVRLHTVLLCTDRSVLPVPPPPPLPTPTPGRAAAAAASFIRVTKAAEAAVVGGAAVGGARGAPDGSRGAEELPIEAEADWVSVTLPRGGCEACEVEVCGCADAEEYRGCALWLDTQFVEFNAGGSERVGCTLGTRGQCMCASA